MVDTENDMQIQMEKVIIEINLCLICHDLPVFDKMMAEKNPFKYLSGTNQYF